jgi:endonuclease/exonuclease/phosphatase family metal-dependent hydrolase
VSALARSARLTGLVVLVYALLRLPAAADPPPGTLAFLQFNMCGSGCGTRFAVIGDVAREIRRHRPQPLVVTLQEVCRGQYARLVADLGYGGHFEPTIRNRCWDGTDYGIAVLVRAGDVRYAGSWPLPSPAGGEPRTVTCVRTARLVACSTHLDTDPANTPAQVAEVARRTGAFPGPVVVGGDFNATPDKPAMGPMAARFSEADGSRRRFTGGCSRARCGSRAGYAHPTRKIDYVFLSRSAFTGVSVRIADAQHSDHAPVWVTATLS